MGCSADYENLILVGNLLNVSQKNSIILSSFLLCGWDAQEAIPESRFAINDSGRGIRIVNKEVAAKDPFGRLYQRNKPAQQISTRKFIFQHFATSHEHIVAYREQLYGHVDSTEVSPIALLPQQPTKSLLNGEDMSNNVYINGVLSVAQKYNLTSPSMLQYANWWQHRPQSNGIYGITSMVTQKHEIPESAALIVEQGSFINHSVSQRQKKADNGYNDGVSNGRKNVHQLTIGQQVDQFAKLQCRIFHNILPNNSNVRYNPADLLTNKNGKMENTHSQPWRLPHRIDDESRLEARDASCPEFGRLLQLRLQQLLRDRHIQNLDEEMEEDPATVSCVEVLREAVRSASSRRTGSAALQVTGRMASAGASSVTRQRHNHVNEELIAHTKERPSLPTMPYFRYNSVHLDR